MCYFNFINHRPQVIITNQVFHYYNINADNNDKSHLL
jgi:hypothetical protein